METWEILGKSMEHLEDLGHFHQNMRKSMEKLGNFGKIHGNFMKSMKTSEYEKIHGKIGTFSSEYGYIHEQFGNFHQKIMETCGNEWDYS